MSCDGSHVMKIDDAQTNDAFDEYDVIKKGLHSN